MATSVEVANRAGVSIATVSRVVNSPEKVDPKTREAVQKIIDELGYRPNAVARVLVKQSSSTIGVVINRFSSPYYGHMLDGVERALFEVGFKAIAESSRESASGELSAIDSLLDRQCDGIILHSDKLSNTQLTKLLKKYPQIVVMNRCVPNFEARCVYLDNVQGGALAASHLYECGHKNVAVVTGPLGFFEAKDRLKGFIEQWKKDGRCTNNVKVIEGDFTVASGRESMQTVSESKEDITAIFFMSDEMAAGALDYCHEKGIRVPDDFSFIGFDDMDIASLVYPKLTTIRQLLGSIGAASGALAHAIATNTPNANFVNIFQPSLVERNSIKKI